MAWYAGACGAVDSRLRGNDGRGGRIAEILTVAIEAVLISVVVGYVYILASKPHGTLYTGVTNDLVRRVYEHKEGVARGFSKRYGVKTLVHFEVFDRIDDAILREKRVKGWRRAWKIALIEKDNPDWRDLYVDLAP
jgi:putative endonuclease